MSAWPALLVALSLASSSALAAGTLRIGNGNEPESLDPHKAQGVSALTIVRDLYEGLTSLSPDGSVVPAAAASWDVDADGRRYVFHLQPRARWSNGDAVTAEDFVAGLRRSADPATGSSYSQLLTPIAGAAAVVAGRAPPTQLAVRALDARTLLIELAAPTPYFLRLLTHASTFPIHRGSLARYGAAFARPGRLVGNGAYALAGWVVHGEVALARNRYYWNDAATHLDRVIYYPTEDVGSELKRFRAGELDITYAIPLVQAPWLRRAFGGQLHVAPYLGTYFYGFNVTRPPFAGAPQLRQALSMAIDREVIVAKLLQGLAAPAWSLVPPGTADYATQRPAWADWPRPRRLDEARRLYRAAGYSAEHPLEVEIRYNTQEDHRRLATVIAAFWKQNLGVRTTLVNEEFKVFLADRKARRVTQAFRTSWIADFDDAASFLDVLHSASGRNDTGWCDGDYDALLAQAATSADAAPRQALLEQAERRLLDAAPIMPIYFYRSKHLVRPVVRGWHDNALDYHYAKDLRLATD